ncbi:MAG: hypothetical protein WC712_07990, partial [Candidatus Brocadiia bacterium]
EMAKEFGKGNRSDNLGPKPIFTPQKPPQKLPPVRTKPSEDANPPAGDASDPGQGLGVAALMVGVVAFQVRRQGRKRVSPSKPS